MDEDFRFTPAVGLPAVGSEAEHDWSISTHVGNTLCPSQYCACRKKNIIDRIPKGSEIISLLKLRLLINVNESNNNLR